MFNIVIAIGGPAPYTIEECEASLHVIEQPPELDSVVYCVEPGHVPPIEKIPPDVQRAMDTWTGKQRTI